jgi:hypothetical protein
MDGQGIWHVREKRNVYRAERWHRFGEELLNESYQSVMEGDGQMAGFCEHGSEPSGFI